MRRSGKMKIHSMLARIGTWLMILGILFLLRSFFLLVFLTFVFGFVQARGVDHLGKILPNRKIRVTLVGLAFLGLLSGIALFLTPNLKQQTELFAKHFDTYAHTVDQQIYDWSVTYPSLQDALVSLTKEPGIFPANGVNLTNKDDRREDRQSPTLVILQQLLGIQDSDDHPASIGQLLTHIVRWSGKLVGFVSAFLLALLFSFLIVLDLPHLEKSVGRLKHTKLRFIYREVAPSLYDFSQVLGHALEAQFFIAVINSALTSLGLWLLGLGHYLAFLSTIVFLFSFVPVAGVFISSVPICLVSLQFAGMETMLLAIALITGIHLIEAYVLNPRIYGARMRINPVIVLVILTIGGKLFHFWGLVLGVPVCTWFFSHAIRHSRHPSPTMNRMALPSVQGGEPQQAQSGDPNDT